MKSGSFTITLTAILLLNGGGLLSDAAPEPSRLWTTAANGKANPGTLVSKSPDNSSIVVRLESGREVAVKTALLIPEDQNYVKNWTPPARETTGIVRGRKSSLTQAQGGKSRVMKDLQSILSKYGEPKEDTDPHPEAFVYRGPAWFDGGPGISIPYLMPLDKALALLVKRPGAASRRPALAPGFPPGMVVHEYDICYGVYNRMFVVVDQAGQVVALQAMAETKNEPNLPVVPPWTQVDLPLQSTTDFIEPCTGRAIACVLDLRKTGKYIVIDLEKDAVMPNVGTRRETVLFLPEPMIRLCLHHIEQDLRPGG